MEKFNEVIKKPDSWKPNVEKVNDDMYRLSYDSLESGQEIIKKVAEYFGEPAFYNKEIIDCILNQNQEWRFEGTFSLKLLKDKQLMLDNGNGRGVKENQERLKELISLLLT